MLQLLRSSRIQNRLNAKRSNRPVQGRPLTALFKADEDDTHAAYSVSECILHPGQEGVGTHSHEENDEVFFVLEGRPEILVGDVWKSYEIGAFIRIPAGVAHDFRNATLYSARLLNFYIPGGFERDMPTIVEWFARNQ